MKPWEVLGRAHAPDGTELTLTRHTSEYVILAGGRLLMSSRTHGSEEALATLGCARARALRRPCVLVGGLGMGFTLRAALDCLPPAATVLVSELVPAVVTWNRGPLGALAGRPLDDPRVLVEERDVADALRSRPSCFDAILLDLDNGPAAVTSALNAGIYSRRGVAAAHTSLRAGGTLAVWSEAESRGFEALLRAAGFTVRSERVRARRERGSASHTIFVAIDGGPAQGRETGARRGKRPTKQ